MQGHAPDADDRAQALREQLITLLRTEGNSKLADRLRLPGSRGYPDDDCLLVTLLLRAITRHMYRIHQILASSLPAFLMLQKLSLVYYVGGKASDDEDGMCAQFIFICKAVCMRRIQI